ncbi:serine/threonine-protein kinase ppk15-like isoform X2 [Papaver somniferum]|uniref:serine/threonine-protein kinase ppk15-like isoform X2 n=1 Tax=Papaver somniferum TaxID=3469 RepID=UPI000E6FFAEE|nr:serine/threonine-protein kinase ppk15-like isoform X2 [Papaver somniferum]
MERNTRKNLGCSYRQMLNLSSLMEMMDMNLKMEKKRLEKNSMVLKLLGMEKIVLLPTNCQYMNMLRMNMKYLISELYIEKTGFEENKDMPIVLNSVIAGRYYVTEYLGSAAFSKVIQAHDLQTGIDVCLKIIKNDKDFFDQSLDEIKLLKFVNKHDPGDEHHILRLYDYFYHQEHLFIVCELLRANLYEFQKFNQDSGGEVYFTLRRLQSITRQCLEALEFLHCLGIIHCDLKPENILIKSYSRCEIKVIDLGSSCFESDNLCLYIQSRSYRAPEVILGLPYDQKIDLWSLGCILAELCSGEVLLPNEALVVLLSRIIGMFGLPDMEMLVKGQETHKYFTKEYDLYHMNEETNEMECIIPEESSLEHHLQVSDIGFIEFVKDLLEVNPSRRPTASEALQHPWLSYPY